MPLSAKEKDIQDANRAADEFWGPDKDEAHQDLESATEDLINTAMGYGMLIAGLMPIDNMRTKAFKDAHKDFGDALQTARDALKESQSQ